MTAGFLMLDGKRCHTGPTCRLHAFAIKEAEITAKPAVERSKEERVFIARLQWHPTRNAVSFDEVSTNDSDSWWQCSAAPDHAWQAPKNKRTSRGDGCPFCSGHRASSTNNLTMRPDLAAELDEEAAGVTARELTVASNRNVPWRCRACGHRWNATPNTRQASGCPNCMVRTGGFMLTFETSLAGRHPEIAKEFDVEANGLTAAQVGASDKKVYQWRCLAKGHSYPMAVLNRVRPTASCPVCQNRRITPENSLRALFPQLSSELNEIRSGTTADKIAPGSAKRLFWNCPTGDTDHIYDASPRERTGSTTSGKPTGCPFCSNHRLSKTNSLAATAPGIALEFDEQKNGCKAEDVIAGSPKRYWWKCLRKGHNWYTSPALRTGKANQTNCPKCDLSKTSKIEKAFRAAFAASPLLKNVEPTPNSKVPVLSKNGQKMSVDILGDLVNSSQQVIVEYDSFYYHQKPSAQGRDLWKSNALLEAGYLLIRIREKGLPDLDLNQPNFLQVGHATKGSAIPKTEAVKQVEKWLLSKW